MTHLTAKSGGSEAFVKAFMGGRPETTVEAYRADLEVFAHYVGVESVSEMASAFLNQKAGKANAMVHAYKTEMIESGLAPSTINRRLSAIRSMTKFARQFGLIDWRVEIGNVKATPYRDTRGPGKERVYLMLENLQRGENAKAKRDVALVAMIYALALRASEAINIDLKDIDLESRQVKVLGKGKSERVVMSLPESVVPKLEEWIECRGDDEGPLFYSFDRTLKEKKRLTRSGLYKLVRRIGKKTGLSADVRPHGLRHTAITEAVKSAQRAGITLNEVMQFSRHSSLEVLLRYQKFS